MNPLEPFLMAELPTWEEAKAAKVKGDPSLLMTLIAVWEPAGASDAQWRGLVLGAIREAQEAALRAAIW